MALKLTTTLAWLALISCAMSNTTLAAKLLPQSVQDGSAGFDVTSFRYALSNDATETGACPDGLTPPDLGTQERRRLSSSNDSPCANPEAFGADPNFRTVKAPDARAFGIDLDRRDSRLQNAVTGACPHDDLLGMNGERGIDNQFYRLVGCVHGYQPASHGNHFEIEMLTGSWGILISLSGIDDIRDDDNVEVSFFANTDPISLSPLREPLEFATYAAEQDPRFRARTRGRIADGVLTTEPVDVRFRKVTNAMYLERPLMDAVARMTISPDGTLEGYLAGYTPIEAMYDLEFAFRNARNLDGEPSDLRRRINSSHGRARNLHYTCNGVYYALRELADGHPDPKTGRCTSISTQYQIKAVPAFVADVKTQSLNEGLSP